MSMHHGRWITRSQPALLTVKLYLCGDSPLEHSVAAVFETWGHGEPHQVQHCLAVLIHLLGTQEPALLGFVNETACYILSRICCEGART